MKEIDFSEKKTQMEKDLVAFRASNVTAKKAIPAELKRRQELYTPAALKKLTQSREVADKQATEALLANQGVAQRKAAKGKR